MTNRPKTDVVMLLRNDFTSDSRVEKEATWLSAQGLRVVVLASWRPGVPRYEERDGYRVERLGGSLRPYEIGTTTVTATQRAIAAGALLASKASWSGAVLQRVQQLAPSTVHCHDLNTLPTGAVAARRRRLIYDAHELWTDQHGGRLSTIERASNRAYRAVERLLIRRADGVITVSPGLAAVLEERYRIAPPIVVRNTPSREVEDSPSLQELAGAASPVWLYAGAVAPGRSLEHAVDALEELADVTLVLVGRADPDTLSALRARATERGVADRLLHLPPVPYRQVISMAASADVALLSLRADCLNRILSLPNKLFEYAFAGVPIVATDLPQIREWVAGRSLGVLTDTDDPRALARAVRSVLEGETELANAESRQELRDEICWEREVLALRAVYPSITAAAAPT